MYKLQLENSRFHRVSRGQTEDQILQTFGRPAIGEAREGAVVLLGEGNFTSYRARVGEDYAAIAHKFGIGEDRLRRANGDRPVYPSCVLCIPSADET